jgi:hypothetical protein
MALRTAATRHELQPPTPESSMSLPKDGGLKPKTPTKPATPALKVAAKPTTKKK